MRVCGGRSAEPFREDEEKPGGFRPDIAARSVAAVVGVGGGNEVWLSGQVVFNPDFCRATEVGA